MIWSEAWHKVICSDKKKFNLDGSVGFSYYWRGFREEEIFSTRPQGGGSVIIWGSFGWAWKSSICFVDGQMNSKGYREVLKNYLVDVGGSDWMFQGNNAPVNRSKVNIIWVKSKKINVLSCPLLSSDLNRMENI